MNNKTIAKAYFEAVANKNPEAIEALFHDAAELHTVAGVYKGPQAIADFYRSTAFNFSVVKPQVGPLIEEGDVVSCEIILQLDDSKNKVADFFTITDGKIQKLVVYLGPEA